MIVDAHCHAGRGDGLNAPWDTRADLGRYLRRARAAGIQQTVIVPTLGGNYAQANARLARIAAAHPGRLLCFAAVHPRRDAGSIGDMVAHAVRRLGCRGIKVHRLDAPATREVCDAARRWQVPVLYDVLDQTYRTELLAREYPDVNFIVPHFGSYVDDWRARLQLIDQIARLPNVYVDTSGVRYFDAIVEGIRRAGAHKVLFASDGPWHHPAVELYKIRLLQLPPAEEKLVLGGNILRLIGAAQAPTAARPGLRRTSAAVPAYRANP